MNTECEYIQSRMHEYFDEELDYEMSLRIKKHLEHCSECREIYEKISKLSNLIKQSFNSSSESISL
ncbi:MAG TPA: zf-HC2 domain-containing protein [Candidatus Adamsella sp.]|nr:zf-HC2 domain-containing protein [Candidatus Adamsella sp.]